MGWGIDKILVNLSSFIANTILKMRGYWGLSTKLKRNCQRRRRRKCGFTFDSQKEMGLLLNLD